MEAPTEIPCPSCASRMVHATPWNVPALACTGCRGLWFEVSSLRRYLLAADRRQEVRGTSRVRFEQDKLEAPQSCPGCGANRLHSGYAHSLFVSVCSNCGGVFLPAVAVRSLSPQVPLPPPRSDLQTLMDVVNTPTDVTAAIDALGLLLQFLRWPRS